MLFIYKDKSMSLFTTPLVINDGTDDRTFNWSHQIPGNVLGGLYVETAASPMVRSQLKTLHTTAKSGQERHLIQSRETVDLVDPGADDPAADDIIVNITVAHHPRHNSADVEKRLLLALAAAGATGITAKLIATDI
jgi:hypothetical protein